MNARVGWVEDRNVVSRDTYFPQLKRHVIINGSQHCCVDSESPQSVSQPATVPCQLCAFRLNIL